MEDYAKYRQVLLNSAIDIGKLFLLNCSITTQRTIRVKKIDFTQ